MGVMVTVSSVIMVMVMVVFMAGGVVVLLTGALMAMLVIVIMVVGHQSSLLAAGRRYRPRPGAVAAGACAIIPSGEPPAPFHDRENARVKTSRAAATGPLPPYAGGRVFS